MLDNPIWSSLDSLHRAHAIAGGEALRYPADVAPFLGVPREGAAAPLDVMVRPDEEVFCVGPTPRVSGRWRVTGLGQLEQMICEQPMAPGEGPPIVPLEAHRPAVLELTALVYPHYFRPRTIELGRYFGVLQDGRLAAMVGERMGMPGFREVSAVCTHPDFVGRGLARHLLGSLTNDILKAGSVPFLHVSPSNARALALYRQNGYRTRARPQFSGLKRV